MNTREKDLDFDIDVARDALAEIAQMECVNCSWFGVEEEVERVRTGKHSDQFDPFCPECGHICSDYGSDPLTTEDVDLVFHALLTLCLGLSRMSDTYIAKCELTVNRQIIVTIYDQKKFDNNEDGELVAGDYVHGVSINPEEFDLVHCRNWADGLCRLIRRELYAVDKAA